MHKFEDIAVETRGHVAQVTIKRPDRLNALRMTITDREIIEALRAIERDDAVRVVILTGAGERAFCTGWDMEAIEDTPLDKLEALVRANLELFFKIWHQRQPVIAAINGYAVGTGSGMALACDLALAAEHARLGEPEIRHGALSPFLMLPFLTHNRAVHEIYYTGDLVPAPELYRLGIVNRVVPAAELNAAAWAFAERLAKVPPHALQMKKRSLRLAYDLMGASAAVRQHALADTLVIGANTPEQSRLLDILAKEGMRAFLEARDGPFRS
ncbi:MAG: enoyl-CoA hydratase/isomerase family protein [Rhodospirillaceae bacterium]|nr:enoyl-CoA hydratase/isomerase family protein [Rhodospirillaceae bacterium]